MRCSGESPSSLTAVLNLTSREIGKTNYQASDQISFDALESEPIADFVAEIVQSTLGAVFNDNITVMVNPLPTGDAFIPLTITYYDNYNWVANNPGTPKIFTDSYNSLLDAGTNAYPINLPTTAQQSTVQTIGMITGSRVRVLEDPTDLTVGKWLTSAIFYVENGRPIQTNMDNYKGGTDITTNRYDFTGKIICTYAVNNTPQQTPSVIRIKTALEYDHGGRLERIWKTINDEHAKKALIVQNTYDELGNLKRKELGAKRNTNGTYTSTPIENLDYNYNIRGWLKGINTAYTNISPEIGGTSASPWFGLELNYDWGSSDVTRNSYRGNISNLKWRSRGNSERRAYGFTYEGSNRLLGADFSQYNGSAYVDNGAIQFDVVMGDGFNSMSAYDVNGNIKAMKQWGLKLNTSSVIGQLTYNYYNYSNKLKSVSEPVGSTDNKLGDFTDKHAGATDDYGYDMNGNMITDLNKGINGNTGINQSSSGPIEYNHLNLPWKITVTDDVNPATTKGIITFIYDASGNKLEKRMVDNTNPSKPNKTTTYNGSMVYEDNILQLLNHEEGRTIVDYAAGQLGYHHDYFIKDHLGNVRMVLTDELKTDIYPAATVEGNLNTSTDATYLEKSYFSIDPANVVPKSQATGIPDYPNNNGVSNNNPNSNPTAKCGPRNSLCQTAMGRPIVKKSC